MPGQSQNYRGSDRGMKNSGTLPQALRSYPQHLTSQGHRKSGPGCSGGPVSLSRRWHLETQRKPDLQNRWVWFQLILPKPAGGGDQRPIAEVAELQPAVSLS